MADNCRKQRKVEEMLPDVIGTWKFENNRGDPGGSGPDGAGLGTTTTVQELQPISDAVPPKQSNSDPIYLEVTERVPVKTAVTSIGTSNSGRPSILFNPSTMERRSSTGQVCYLSVSASSNIATIL